MPSAHWYGRVDGAVAHAVGDWRQCVVTRIAERPQVRIQVVTFRLADVLWPCSGARSTASSGP